MAIQFRCAQCMKFHRIADRYAGLPGRCGRCGYRFVAPGSPRPSPPAAPMAAPNLDLDDDVPRGRSWSGVAQAIGLGLFAALILAGLLFALRDRLVIAHPALAPLLPPQAPALASPVAVVPLPGLVSPARPQATTSGQSLGDSLWSVVTALEALGRFLVGLGIVGVVLALTVFIPLVVPPIMSRRGYLSVGRWVVFAVLAMFLLVCNVSLVSFLIPQALIYPNQATLLDVVRWTISPLFMAVIGCLVAAGIHPKSPQP